MDLAWWKWCLILGYPFVCGLWLGFFPYMLLRHRGIDLFSRSRRKR